MKQIFALYIIIFSFEIFSQPLIIAHRGAMGHAPENTISAFLKAIELGANAIEIDLRQTKDGELVAFHDGSINRTTNGKGKFENFTFVELRNLDAGSWFNIIYKEEKIPTLQEIIDILSDSVLLIIELKGDNNSYPNIEENTVSLIKKNNIEKQTILKSFDYKVLKRLRVLAPNIPQIFVYALRIPIIGVTIGTGLNFESIYSLDVEYLQPHRYFVTEEFVRKAEKKGYKIISWGVDSRSSIINALEIGVHGIETDYPERVLSIINEIKN